MVRIHSKQKPPSKKKQGTEKYPQNTKKEKKKFKYKRPRHKATKSVMNAPKEITTVVRTTGSDPIHILWDGSITGPDVTTTMSPDGLIDLGPDILQYLDDVEAATDELIIDVDQQEYSAMLDEAGPTPTTTPTTTTTPTEDRQKKKEKKSERERGAGSRATGTTGGAA